MTRQWLYIAKYDWLVCVYYAVGADDAEEVMGHLLWMGICGEDAEHAWHNLTDGKMDEGITFSAGRRSVVVIGAASGAAEYANTIGHELEHLATHISDALGVDLRSEEYAYLRGELTRDTHEVSKRFICECHDNG